MSLQRLFHFEKFASSPPQRTALTKGKKYYYRIYAINSNSRSAYSATVSVVL